MQLKSQKQLFEITVVFEGGKEKLVKVKAVKREVAENRALKWNPSAIGVKIDA